jgi:hypothetical protein
LIVIGDFHLDGAIVLTEDILDATTNLNAAELEGRYGNRVRSRMRELFNLLAFDKGSLDKRK